ncbi:MAG: hypothetical protein PHD03_01240 [Bacilli bacterium]|nr:hypothetical protein [Bacilli bacterium]MDD4406552.1 hypothetical protein [Bacilli bacterium]
MISNLFNNNIEEKAFYDLIAARKYFYKNKEKQLYDSDIEEYLHKCDEILKENNARCNFIAEILARKNNALKNGVYNGNNRLSEIDALTKEFIDFLKTVPLSVKEDLEFYSKRIDDRLQRNTETSLEQQTILEYYPKVDNIDYNETFAILASIFDNVDSFGVKKENDYNENLIDKEVPYVEPIFSSLANSFIVGDEKPKINEGTSLEDENLLAEEAESKYEEPINDIPIKRHEVIGIKTLPIKDVVSDIKEEDQIKEEIELNPFDKMDKAIAEMEFEKENQIEPENNFVTDINFELSDLEQEEDMPKEIAELIEEPEIPLDIIEPVEDRHEINNEKMVSFNMPKGFSLVDIAVALCGDSNGWIDIYDANKAIFNKIVNEKNNGNFNDVENNPDLFADLNINIPTVFKKDIPKSSLKVA